MFQGLPMCHLLCPCCLCTPGSLAAKEKYTRALTCFLHTLVCSSQVKPRTSATRALAQRSSFGITAGIS
jgi:hypothetical protein